MNETVGKLDYNLAGCFMHLGKIALLAGLAFVLSWLPLHTHSSLRVCSSCFQSYLNKHLPLVGRGLCVWLALRRLIRN